jgi:hypothetical protein
MDFVVKNKEPQISVLLTLSVIIMKTAHSVMIRLDIINNYQ